MKHRLLAAGLLLAGFSAKAQQHRSVVQFTGMVVSGDSLVGLLGVSVRVPATNRRTLTSPNGYFSLAVLAGDSILIQASKQTARLRIPAACQSQSYSLLVELKPETTQATWQPLPPEFAHSFMALKVPPPLTIEAPTLSAKELLLLRPAYDRKGRRTN